MLKLTPLVALGLLASVVPSARAAVEDSTRLAGAAKHELQAIGWSPDERYVALRHFALQGEADFDGGEMPPLCKGYIDHTGKKFRGTLELLIFDGSKLLERHPIQDGTGSDEERDGLAGLPVCTPFPIAKQRLVKAKTSLARLGIDKSRGGEVVQLAKDRLKLAKKGALEVLRVDIRTKNAETEDINVRVTGNISVGEKNGTGMRIVVRRKLQEDYSLNMAGGFKLAFGDAFVSPSGKAALFTVNETWTSMRGNSTSPSVIGMVKWDGKKLVAP